MGPYIRLEEVHDSKTAASQVGARVVYMEDSGRVSVSDEMHHAIMKMFDYRNDSMLGDMNEVKESVGG